MLSKPYAESSGGSSDGDVDVESQQIADRVGVLGAIQPVQQRAARIRRGGRRAVDAGFERRRERVIARLVGTPRAQRGHRPRVELADDLSHTAASRGTFARSIASNATPPDFTREL